MKKIISKNNKFKNPARAIICVLLCILIGLQSAVFVSAAKDAKEPENYKIDEKYKNCYSIANIDDEIAEIIGETDPELDALIDLYMELSLYDVTREQAITSMLRKFLIDYPGMMPEMANALLTAFDNYGRYYQSITTQEIFSSVYRGYGIMLGGKNMMDGIEYNVIIKQVFEYSPADRAGLKPGDEIIKVENRYVEGLGLNAVSNLLNTYAEKVSITIKRDGKEMTFTLDKGTVYVPAVTLTADDKTKTAIMKIDNFTDEYMVYDIFNIFDFLEENEYKNIIIDLRDNPGGDVWNMLETLNMFVPDEGVLLYSQIYKNGEIDSVESSGDGIAFDNICVLTNGRSASASEIFTLSLKELTGAVVIGEKTYGKGIGQFYVPLDNGDTAAITGFEILSANGTRYHKKGIEPDIEISPEYITVEKKTYAQLNFVNCVNIKKGADNNAALALNQRLAAIGYISPEDITSECTEKTITAVEIFQKYNGLPVGINKIDYIFLEYLNYYVSYYSVGRYQERDVQFECAEIYIKKGEKAVIDFIEELNKDKEEITETTEITE